MNELTNIIDEHLTYHKYLRWQLKGLDFVLNRCWVSMSCIMQCGGMECGRNY